MMRCLDRRVLIGLGALALGIWVLAPQRTGPALVVAASLACPASMLLMMRGMGGGRACRSTGTPGTASTGTGSDAVSDRGGELARLRAEIDSLKADLMAADPDEGDPPDAGAVPEPRQVTP